MPTAAVASDRITEVTEPHPPAGQARNEAPGAGSPAAVSSTPPEQRVLAAATAIYLALPAILFAYGWLRWPFAALSIALLSVCAAVAWADLVRGLRAMLSPASLRTFLRSSLWIAPAGLLIAAWLCLSGAGGVGFQVPDYQKGNALLKDLIQGGWPMTTVLDGAEQRIVYYLGYYLVPAAVGKAFGWGAANLALFAWTAVGAGLAFGWFRRISRVELDRRPGRLLWLALMFCLAGGLDTLASLVREGRLPGLTRHLEPWAGAFQYSSNTTLLYWVPQHSLAAWLMTGMVVTSIYAPRGLRYLPITLAAGILWSPFGVIGLAPFLVLLPLLHPTAQWRQLLAGRSTIMLSLAAAWVAAIHGLYLASNRYQFPIGLAWGSAGSDQHFVRLLLAFWLVEFALVAAVAALLLAAGVRASRAGHSPPMSRAWLAPIQQRFGIEPVQLALLGMSVGILFFLPLFKAGYLNDLVMRASIPSLFVFHAFVAKLVLDANLQAARRPDRLRLGLLYLALLSLVVVGFLPAVAEVSRSARFYRLGPPAYSEVAGSAQADPRPLVEQRLGNEDSLFYRVVGR